MLFSGCKGGVLCLEICGIRPQRVKNLQSARRNKGREPCRPQMKGFVIPAEREEVDPGAQAPFTGAELRICLS